MARNINFLMAGGILLISIISSCKKYLDEKSNNTLTVPKTIQDLQGLLDDGSQTINLSLTPCMGQASSDDYFLLQNTYETRPLFDQQLYTWSLTNYNWDNDWSKGYTPIYISNYCLEMLEDIPITIQNEPSWKNVKGSALFYRAYNFLNLTWNYSKAYDELSSNTDLGIVLRLESDFNTPSIRASVKDCYERIIDDAKECIPYLPITPLHTFRPSIPAAYALLARAYLSMGEYDSALKYSDLCLQLKKDLIDCNVKNTADYKTEAESFPFRRFNKETIFYTELAGISTNLTPSRARVDTFLYSSYSDNDWRKTAFFNAVPITTPIVATYYSFKGSYAESGIMFTGISTNELYLIKSECLARVGANGSGDKDSALKVLNTLLLNRWKSGTFTGITAATAAEALDKILIERRKELLFRGLRWIDIKRLNKEGRNIIPKRIINGQPISLPPNSNYYALPLPTDIINITGIPQNPI